MLFSLIDPDKFFLKKGAEIARASYEGGADVILVGGSIGVQGTLLDDTVRLIKEAAPIPVVLYPGSPAGLTPFADAVYFMQMLNSRDVYWLSTAQIQGAPVVARMKLEVIPTTYLVIEPGRAVGWIGSANPIPRERSDLAAACALAAKYLGSHALITDSGSGAPSPAPASLIKAVARVCGKELFYFYGGGVRTGKQAADVIRAGAHGIQVGNIFEGPRARHRIKEIARAVRREGRKRT